MTLCNQFAVGGMVDHVVEVGKCRFGRWLGISVNAVGVAIDAVNAVDVLVDERTALGIFLAVARVCIV